MTDDEVKNENIKQTKEIKLRTILVYIALATTLGGLFTFFNNLSNRVEINTREIEHSRELHDKDMSSLRSFHVVEETACAERRKIQNDRIKALEDRCKEVEEDVKK